MYQKGQVLVWVAVAVMVVTILAGGYYASRSAFLKYLSQNPVATPQPTPSPITNETANWKTYTSTKYGFSFKYPSNAKLTEGGYYSVDGVFVPQPKGVSLTATIDKDEAKTLGRDGFQLTISVADNKEDEALSQLRQEISPDKNSLGLDWSGLKIEEVSVDGNPAIKGNTSGPYGSYTVMTIYKDKIYRFVFEPTISKTSEQILSTFKFIAPGGIETVVLGEGYEFDVTLPSGYQYKKERVGDIVGYIADQNGEKFIRFYISSAGGERSPRGKTTIDGVPFTIDLRSNIGCNADFSATNAKYPGPDKLYFQIMAASCKGKDYEEWVAGVSPVNKDMEQIIQSIKFNFKLKELLLGNSQPPVLRKSLDDVVGPIGK